MIFSIIRGFGSRVVTASRRRCGFPKPSDLDDFPILDRFGEGGGDSPEFVEAWLAAYGPLGLDEFAAEMAAEYADDEPEPTAELSEGQGHTVV